MIFNRSHTVPVFFLSIYSISLLAAFYVFAVYPLSALSFIACLISVVCFSLLRKEWLKQNSQIKKVLQALNNGDPTLGLPENSPLLFEFNNLKRGIQQSKNDLHAQSHFFESLIQHLDFIILVVDDKNNILHKNSAADRIIGIKSETIIDDSWGELGDFIINSQKSAKKTILWEQQDQRDTLSVRLSRSKYLDRSIKIINIQSIHEELVDKELDAYKRLTKVLVHEVSNSVTPISMLSTTTANLLPRYLQTPNIEDKDDITEALSTIEKRINHLSTFVERFVEINNIPLPHLQFSDLKKIINRVLFLLKDLLQESNVHVWLQTLSIEYKTMLDPVQIEQVLLNVIKNSVESLKQQDDKKVEIKLYHNSKNQLIIDIIDNGSGIPLHVQERIFIPFFTTKPNGSGIGLSLSKQIMRNHNGNLIYVDDLSKEYSGSCFRFIFD